MGSLKALRTRGEPEARFRWKLELVKLLYRRGNEPEDIRKLFDILDRFMHLPPAEERAFEVEHARLEEALEMPVKARFEQRAHEAGHQEGRQDGLREAVLRVLEARFGSVPDSLKARVEGLKETEALDALLARAAVVGRLEELEESS